MSTQGIKATTGAAQAPAPITTDAAPTNQAILPTLQTVPEAAIFMGGAYKDLTALVKSTWLQSPSIINIPLNATSGTVVLNVPLYGEMLSDAAKVFILLHSRFFGSVHYRITVFGASTMIGGLEVGWTIRHMANPTINDLRVIKGETIPANNCQVYTFNIGPIVPSDGIQRNFFTTQGNAGNSATNFVDPATMDWTAYPHFVVLQNIPLQSNITAELNQVYMRVETMLDPNFSVVLDNLQRLTHVKNALLTKVSPNSFSLKSTATSFINLIGLPLSKIFNSEQLYLSLDGKYSLSGLNLRTSFDHFDLKQQIGFDSSYSMYSWTGITKENGGETQIGFYQAKITGDEPQLTGYLVTKFNQPSSTILAFTKYHQLSNISGVESSLEYLNIDTVTTFGVLTFDTSGQIVFDYDFDITLDDDFPLDWTTGLVAASYLSEKLKFDGTSQNLLGVSYTGPAPTFDTYEYKEMANKTRDHIGPVKDRARIHLLGFQPTVDGVKKENVEDIDFKILGQGMALYSEKGNKLLFFYSMTIPAKYVQRHGAYTAVFYLDDNIPTSQCHLGLHANVLLRNDFDLSDFSYSFGGYLNSPTFDLFVKVPERARRVVFTERIPPSVSQGLSGDGIPTAETIYPSLFPSMTDNEVLNFNLVTPNNNQTIFTVCYAAQYKTFYIVPVDQALDLYATYNSHDCQNLIFQNPVKTTIGNLPRSSMANDFQSRIVKGTDTDTLILPLKTGPRLTTVTRAILKRYQKK